MLIKIKIPAGALYLNPDAVAAITDFIDGPRGIILGCSMVYLYGGTALMVPLAKDETASALGLSNHQNEMNGDGAANPFRNFN